MFDDLKFDTFKFILFTGDKISYLYWWLTVTFDLYLDYICFASGFSLRGMKSTDSLILAVLS
jgi:hypothetical protein